MKYVVLSSKKWNENLHSTLQKKLGGEWRLISKKEDFNIENLSAFGPDKIFIPHWSYLIPEEIITKYECIIFHMTDLPYGRGGSPLQNLILEGATETKISAIKATNRLDEGDVYYKKELSLEGMAEDIYHRANDIIEEMIVTILNEGLKPSPQQGTPTIFKRRKPEQSNIQDLQDYKSVYNYIRMLDAEGYPHAFLETENFKLEFTKASEEKDGTVKANVRFIKK